MSQPVAKMSIDECVTEAWDTCENEGNGPELSAAVDMWWYIVIECNHGKYAGESRGPLDPSTGFRNALTTMRSKHPWSRTQP